MMKYWKSIAALLICVCACSAWARDTTFYIGSVNPYKLYDSTFTIYAENRSPAVHNASITDTNNPLGCEYPRRSLPGPLYAYYELYGVYQVPVNVLYTDGTVANRQYGQTLSSHTHYIAAGSGEVASCLASRSARCTLNFYGTGSIGAAGWTGQQALVIPKLQGKIVKAVTRDNGIGVITCYMYVRDSRGNVYPELNVLTNIVDSNGVLNYNPNTPTCTVTAPTLSIPAGTTTKAVSVAVGAGFGAAVNQNIAIACSGKTTGGMTITVGAPTGAHATLNASNNNGIMANTGTASGVSAKLSFTGSTGGDCAVVAAPVAFGKAQNLCNGQNLTVGVQGQLVRTEATVGPGSITNALVVNLQYN